MCTLLPAAEAPKRTLWNLPVLQRVAWTTARPLIPQLTAGQYGAAATSLLPLPLSFLSLMGAWLLHGYVLQVEGGMPRVYLRVAEFGLQIRRDFSRGLGTMFPAGLS